MDFNQVKELIEIVNSSELRSFEINLDGAVIKMSKNSETFATQISTTEQTLSQAVQSSECLSETISKMEAVTKKTNEITGNAIKAPIVGTFYASSAPGKDDFVKVGDRVQKGDVVCIIEAMKVMNEVVSEFNGVVKAICVENESLVEYGQPLFTIG